MTKNYLNKLRNDKIEEKFSVQMVHNADQLSKLVNIEIDKIMRRECKHGIKNRIAKLVTVNEYKENIKDNNCIAEEICNKKFDLNDDELKNEIKIYINNNDNSENGKIKDEIDEGIYEVIRNILKGKEEKVDCIVDYMKRTKKVDKFYTPDLLFDEEKLKTNINPIVVEYKNTFIK
jgi:hypothetical protein